MSVIRHDMCHEFVFTGADLFAVFNSSDDQWFHLDGRDWMVETCYKLRTKRSEGTRYFVRFTSF